MGAVDLSPILEFKLWKLGLLLAVIAIWAFWRGFNGKPLGGELFGREEDSEGRPQQRPEDRR